MKQKWSAFLTRDQVLWLLALLVISAAGAGLSGKFKETMGQYFPETIPVASTFNKKPSGYSALFEVLQRSGVKAQRWQSPYRDLLRRDIKGTLVIIAPFEAPLPAELDLLQRWLDRGNDLVYIDTFAYGTGHSVLHFFDLQRKSKRITDETLPVTASLPEAQHAPFVHVTCQTLLQGGVPVVKASSGAVFTQRISKSGRCLIGAMPAFCANAHISDPLWHANFQFLTNWLVGSPQPILFDEKSHGFSTIANAIAFLLHGPMGYVILQLLVIFLVAWLSLNQRFERLRTVNRARKLSNLEFIDGAAYTYERVGARDAALAMWFNPFKAKLCKALAVAPHASNAEIAEKWAAVGGASMAHCESFLHDADRCLDQRNISRQELLDVVACGDELVRQTEVLHSRGSVR